MHEQLCPIGLIHPIGRQFFYFENTQIQVALLVASHSYKKAQSRFKPKHTMERNPGCLISEEMFRRIQWRIQNFSTPEEAPTYNMANFSQKLYENKEILAQRWGAHSLRPLDLPLGNNVFTEALNVFKCSGCGETLPQ